MIESGVTGGVGQAALAGALAGLGVALPLGAIGVLLLQEAVTRGWRTASAGAFGVAAVDLGYAAVAVLAGASTARVLAGREAVVRGVGAALLVLIAVRGLVLLRRAARIPPGEVAAVVPAGPGAVLARFVALTALNPLTAVYFVALAAGSAEALRGGARAGAFLAGVFVASLGWQVVLVGTGALAGARLGTRTRVLTGVAGHLVVLGYAVGMLV